jgi:hypothetical protein
MYRAALLLSTSVASHTSAFCLLLAIFQKIKLNVATNNFFEKKRKMKTIEELNKKNQIARIDNSLEKNIKPCRLLQTNRTMQTKR